MLKVQMLAVLAAAILAIVTVVNLWGNDASSKRAPTDVRTVTVHNDCPREVWLFYGPNSPLRPQDALPLVGDGSVAQPMLEGDTIWLLDQDRRLALDHTTVGSSTDTIVVDPSCRTIAPASL